MKRKDVINFGETEREQAYFKDMDPFDQFLMMMTDKTIIKVNVHCQKHSIATVASLHKEFRDALTDEQRTKIESALDNVSSVLGEICDTNETVINFLLKPGDPSATNQGGL